MQPLVKWSGSKRYLAKQIVALIPEGTQRFIDPFCGGCSIIPDVYESGIHDIRCSDINRELIQIFRLFQSDPEYILDSYENRWHDLQERGDEYYYEIRDRFNQEKSALDFLFLTRTCYNGLIRFNKNSDFNTSFHVTRPGIHPDKLRKIYHLWINVLNHTEFYCDDYLDTLSLATGHDFVFIDPPYSKSNGRYGTFDFDYEKLFGFMRTLNSMNVKWMLTLDNDASNDGVGVPDDLFVGLLYGVSSNSSFRRMKNNRHSDIKERIYINYELEEVENSG